MAGLLAMAGAIILRFAGALPPLGWGAASAALLATAALCNIPLFLVLRSQGSGGRAGWTMMRPLFLAAILAIPILAL